MSILVTVRRVVLPAVLACLFLLAPTSLASSSSVLPGFKSPSGNIKCLYIPTGGGYMNCSLAQANYARQLIRYCAQPKIGVDWAGFSLGRKGKGRIECSGGTLYEPSKQHPHYVTLAYGKTWKHGVFTCTSRVNGVTCVNRTGHGLFVAREAWRAF